MANNNHDKMVKAVLKIYAPPSGGGTDPGTFLEEISLQFNPAEISLVKEVSWARHQARSAEHTAMPEFLGSRPRTLSMNVMLDEKDKQGQSVDRRVKRLMEHCVPTEYSRGNELPSPPWVSFHWGTFESVSFLAFLSRVKATYTRFSAQGDPLRAVCEVTLEEIGTAIKGQNPTSGSPTSRDSYTFVQGDSLQSVATRQSGRPGDWRAVAALNGIDDPSKIRPGHELLLPSSTGQ
ncbi:LysM peptidoglycan-binding domain-containing protein [Streptomyces sp. H27-C3]|uniref:CIS tube protein n=1 Tax=Streptomyces sp. H27-C3 TaxID=3046305 RepID=UPI0024BB8755|nr:LysM peptidoglycan-binding domain-containing protein [Streptomyces sp. H27-C3]MDJ0466198.1 LysM peptidoglycan-binding domain-containing protein [Streptomyces sp. H27-C3]